MADADAQPFEAVFQLLASAPRALLAAQPDGTLLWLNEAARRRFRGSSDGTLGRQLSDIAVDDDALRQLTRDCLRSGTAQGHVCARMADGTTALVETRAWRAAGSVAGPLMFALGETTSVGDAMRQFALFEHAPFALALSVLPQRRLVAVNHAFIAWFGRSREELLGRTGVEAGLVSPDDQQAVFAEFARTGEVRNYPCQLLVASGERRWFFITVRPVSLDGQPHVLTTLHDVHERIVAERAAEAREREAAERTRELEVVLDAVADAVMVYDSEGRVVWSNPAARALLPYSDDDRSKPLSQRASGWNWYSAWGGRLAAEDLPLAQVLATGHPVRDFVVGMDALGEARRWFSVSGVPFTHPGGGGGVVAAFSDVTAQFKAEQIAATERQLLQAIIDGTPSMILAFDREGRILLANDAAAAFLGRPRQSLIGIRPPDELNAVTVREVFQRHVHVVATGESEMSEVEVPLDGTVRTVLVSQHPLRDSRGLVYGSASITTDITERKTMEAELRRREADARQARADLEEAVAIAQSTEEKLRQAQKTEAIGRLAGGVAHDFNNLLTVILGGAEQLRDELAVSDPLRDVADEVDRAGRRAADLTRQLLAFSRRQVLEPRVVDVSQLVHAAEKMLRRVVGEDIEVTLLLDTQPGLCRLDPGQFEQVLMNLVVNARDAMPDGGRLTIETCAVTLDAEHAAQHPGSTPGPHMMVSVSDTGSGMSRDTLSRLFEPFFTTKAVGHGTGLGLATVQGIVQQSGGTIWVYSELGQGTAFRIYFPRVVAEGPDTAPTPTSGPARRTGTETILLVEDDELVRRSVGSMLRRAGYHVIEAANGGEALLVCEQHGGTIHLLLSDVIMPKINGRKLANRLQQIRPALRVIFMSGYTEHAIVHHGVLDSGIDFVPKPLTAEALLTKVRAVLDRPEASAASAD